MRTQSRILNLVAAVIDASVTAIASAQEPQKQSSEKPEESTQGDQSDSIIVCPIYLTKIYISVTDGNNRPIPNLSHEDFAIFEDDVEQQIESWFHDGSSVSFSLAFDISDYEPLKLMARQVARGFVGKIRSTDEVTIPRLNADSQAVLGFAADKPSLENALVVLDDRRYMARSAAQLREQRTRGLLTRLAAASGGLALVVKSEDEISAATEQIIHRLKNQCTIAYSPTNEKYDGSFRYVRVTVMPKDKRKVKVFAPSGYYAVDPEKIKEEKINDK